MIACLAMMCIAAHAADDVGMNYAPTSEQVTITDISAPAMPIMPVVMVQYADMQTAPVVMYFVHSDIITSQMASQVFMCANTETRRKSFVPPNYERSTRRCGQLNHYRNYTHNYRH